MYVFSFSRSLPLTTNRLSQDLGAIRNIKSVLGPRPLLWCCPTTTPGTGLRYGLSNAEGELIFLSHRKAEGQDGDIAHLA